ncbi:hypothetical protein DL95DRAFT_470378 [Leptodontidium sp. 2 PMI_412]|nr:hypothetical protein DL95DRAFT_470378 [Leptodontidium sp. 2 PMI_412]
MPSSTFKLLAATLLITLIIFINPFNNCYYDFNRNSHHSPVLLNDLTLSLSNTSALLLSAFSHDILLSNDIRSTYRDLDYLWNDYPYLPLLDTKADYITYCSGSKPQPQYQPQCDLQPRFYSLMTRMLNIRTQVLSSLSLHALDIEILDTKTKPYLKPP